MVIIDSTMKRSTFLPVMAGFIIGSSSLALLPGTAKASAPLLTGFGGPQGFGTTSVFRNDDSGIGPIANPFPLNFYGTTYNNYFVNTNGNITFESVFGTYTPTFFPGAPEPIIAPWWADVDTRTGPDSTPASTGDDGLVWYTSPDPNTTVVTWNNVGYYFETNPPSNNFQLVLRNLAPTTGTVGDFSFEFRYNELTWTTGDASGGVNGLGGTPAVAGFDSGNGTDYFTIPDSETAQVLNLVNTTNVNEPGVWRFEVRNGAVVDPRTSVPGPLPIFGFAATLAWSRRLRKRISATAHE
jgi:hypothetical protein